MLRYIVLTLICCSTLQVVTGQDFTFSQFYEMPMLRNPALAGVFNGDVRVTGVHRAQWGSVTVPYQTSALGLEYKVPVFNYDDFLTLGLQATYDVAGDVKLKRTQLLPVLNFHKSLSDDINNYLSLAFMGGPVRSQFDPTKARLDDQFANGSYSPANPTAQFFKSSGYTYWDASTGLVYSSSFGYEGTYYLGAALYHFTKPKMNFFNSTSDTYVQKKWAFNAGVNMPFSDMNRVLLYADYMSQGGNRQGIGGFLYETDLVQYDDYDNVTLGLGTFYRWGDAVVPVVRLVMHGVQMGLSYDVNVSQLKTASQFRGGFEFTASFKGFLNANSSTKNKVRCIGF